MFWSVLSNILWARRLVIALTVLCCLAGGALIVLTVPPRYDATARVRLNNITTPDPILGMIVSRKTVDAYVTTQLGMVRDGQVVGPALEAIGWFDDPDLIASYSSRPAADQRDFPTWLVQTVLPGLQASLVEDTDLMEIKFRASSPALAKLVVGAIRDSYIANGVSDRRNMSSAQAEYQQRVADKLRTELVRLQEEQVTRERETGIILQANGVDLDSARLSQLAVPELPPTDMLKPAARPMAQAALDALDSEIARATETLGPNHPKLQQLRRARETLAAAAQRGKGMAEATQAAVAERARADAGIIAAQTAKVLSHRKDLVELRLRQDQINATAKAYTDAVERVAFARQSAATIESGLTSVGDVEAQVDPAFPNKALILGGTGGFGLLAGLLIALIVELLNLRVRTLSGLKSAAGVPILGSVPRFGDGAPDASRSRFRLRLRRLKPAAA